MAPEHHAALGSSGPPYGDETWGGGGEAAFPLAAFRGPEGSSMGSEGDEESV